MYIGIHPADVQLDCRTKRPIIIRIFSAILLNAAYNNCIARVNKIIVRLFCAVIVPTAENREIIVWEEEKK